MIDKTQDLEKRLVESVEGDVRFDRLSRILYSTDASLYQIEPIGVFLPKSRSDVIAAIQIANEMSIPVIPRGGGTGLAGQTLGKALIIDFSKYLNQILELNIEERWVRVQPGVVLDELNAYLKPHGFHFAPDVATSSRANLGGMIANNSAGAHSIKYGKTIDHVLELEVILSDGTVCTWGEMDVEEVRARAGQKDLEGEIFREVVRLSHTHRDEIDARYPKILRRVGGYNLDAFVDGQPFNMSRMVIGSEGTLAAVIEAKLNLEPLPAAKALGVIQFDGLIESMRAVTPILETHPSALELIDKMILDQTKGSIELSKQRTWVEGDPHAVLVVEYYGDSQEEVDSQLDALEKLMNSAGLGYGFRRATSAKEQEDIWNIRKAGLGLLMGIVGDAKPVAFVEDAAVRPDLLPEYIEEFERIVKSHNTVAGYYAHASVGLLHIRPIVNLKSPDGVAQMKSIAEQVRDLVLKYGGSMSGEHGDGLVRSCWNEKMFGSQLYGAFKEIKHAFDPKGLMNPGKIVDAPMMTENLRIGPHYHAEEPETHFDFSSQGGFARAVEMCNGVGECRKKLVGTMCPSYMATLDEVDSTRGRANALRAAISGELEGGLSDDAVYDALDLCLECKACKSECPSNVDMAKLKYEFIAHYYEKHGRPLRAWLFGNIETINKLGCLFAPLSNWISASAPSRVLMQQIGIAPERTLPPFARRTFERWFRRRHGATSDRKIALFADTYLNYNYPVIGEAATEVFEAAGYEVLLAEKRCCGRPMLSSGMMSEVKKNAAYNVDRLSEYVKEGYEIVGFEPSCVSMLTDDYLDLIPGEATRRVADHSYTFESYLSKVDNEGNLDLSFSDIQKTILVHGHCHQKALWGMGPSLDVLNLPPGYSASAIDSACCGMAGAFGYEQEHYEISLKIGEERLLKVVREASPDVEIVAAGISCREQITQTTGRKVRHPAEVLRDALV